MAILEEQDALLESSYIKWIYENHKVCNGDMLIGFLEDGHSLSRYFSDQNLPDDSELIED